MGKTREKDVYRAEGDKESTNMTKNGTQTDVYVTSSIYTLVNALFLYFKIE